MHDALNFKIKGKQKMKKIILSTAIAIAMGVSASAFAASDFDYQGGAVAGTAGASNATSGGTGISGGTSVQGSQAISTNSTGATASETHGPGTVDVEASTVSIGSTSQDSFSAVSGSGVGATGALTAQGGRSSASADGVTGDLAFGGLVGSGAGVAAGVGGASVDSESKAASGALTAATGNGSASYDTIGGAGNANFAGTSVQANVASDPNITTTTLDQDSYTVSTGFNVNAIDGTQTGSAFGLAGSTGSQVSSAKAGALGGMLFGNVGGGETVVGAGLAGNFSQTDQASSGLVFGINNGDAVSTTGTFASNVSGSNLLGSTVANNSLTTVTTGSYEVGTANVGTFNSNNIDAVNANTGGSATEAGISGSAAGFTTLP